MIHKLQLLKRGIAVLVFVAGPLTSVAASAGSAVYVTDVEQLYAAVDNPANMGAIVVLAPGNYQLSPTDPAGKDRTNLGRLELQKDMSLYGVAGDRGAVVIDAAALLQRSFSQPFGRTGVIRTGRGSNAVEWLTIYGNPLAAAAVETIWWVLPNTTSESRTSLRATARVAWTSETSAQPWPAAGLTPKSSTVSSSAASKAFA